MTLDKLSGYIEKMIISDNENEIAEIKTLIELEFDDLEYRLNAALKALNKADHTEDRPKHGKRATEAINALNCVALALKEGWEIEISYREMSAMADCLGFNLLLNTTRKTHVKRFRRGKDKIYVRIASRFSPYKNLPGYACVFPFQIKEVTTRTPKGEE